ncbi:hypothetical protein PMAYCL1PPCAC_23919, partial [Pristionchus mayeri]
PRPIKTVFAEHLTEDFRGRILKLARLVLRFLRYQKLIKHRNKKTHIIEVQVNGGAIAERSSGAASFLRNRPSPTRSSLTMR